MTDSTTSAAAPQSPPHPTPKKSRRSPEDIMANVFLHQVFTPVKKTMMITWLLDVASVLVLVGQVYVLVRIFEGWLSAFTTGAYLSDDVVGFELWVNLGLLFGCMAMRIGMAYARDYLLSRAGLTVAMSVRARLVHQLGQLGQARRYFGSDGVLSARVIDEPDHLIGHARFWVQKMTAVTTPLILAGCISFYSVTVAVILLVTAPLVPIFMALIGIATARKSREQMDALAQLGGRFLDWIRGVNTLSRLGAVDIATQDIATSAESYRKRTMDVLKIAFLNSAVLEFLSALSVALVAVYLGFGLMGILPWAKGQVLTDYGTALFILLLVPEFYAPLRRLGAEYHVKGQAMAAAKSMAPMLDFNSRRLKNAEKTIIALEGLPSFELNHVAVFGDDGRTRLPPTTLHFQAGKRTALMGESGFGKSTLLHILLGFVEFSGDVRVHADGKTWHYADIDVSKLREQMGYLSQSLPLLPISIADNLRLAKPSASDEELIAALEAVGLWTLIKALPMGLHTVLSERGGGLSGGQGQRLAIAQLLLQDAKVWLLDEPTEHLDSQTATNIWTLLMTLSRGKTVIWVTHDESRVSGKGFDARHELSGNFQVNHQTSHQQVSNSKAN